jgi:uncharacterized surface protein with fasciclin (FAS1) repeats
VNRSIRTLLTLLGVVAIGAAACDDDADDAIAPSTTAAPAAPDTTTPDTAGGSTSTVEMPVGDLVATALTNHVFTQLAGMAIDAGLVETLRNGEFTVFAPTDAAFAKIPVATLHSLQDTLDADGVALATTVLLHHVVPGVLTPDQLVDGATFETAAGTTLTITEVGGDLLVEGMPIGAAVEASNGIIYVMDDVLVPD